MRWKGHACILKMNSPETTQADKTRFFFFFLKIWGENLMKTSIHPAALQLWASHRHPTDQSPRLPAGVLRLWSTPSWPLGTHTASTNSTQVDTDKETQN